MILVIFLNSVYEYVLENQCRGCNIIRKVNENLTVKEENIYYFYIEFPLVKMEV